MDSPLIQAIENGDLSLVKKYARSGKYMGLPSRGDLDSPLHIAANQNINDILYILIENGADIHAKNIYHQTPICFAANSGNEDNMVELIGRGADINWRCKKYGSTLLHLALERGNTGVIKILLRAGIKTINCQDVYGDTALHLASWKRNLEICKDLIDYGADSTLVNIYGEKCLESAPDKKARRYIATCIIAAYVKK